MKVYSQNNEQEIILNYFGDKTGSLLDIGANDGETLSNTRQLILNGWSADLVEPAPVPFRKLTELYSENDKVNLFDIAICDYSGMMNFFVSGEHLGKGDCGLLSTLSLADKQKWQASTTYNEITVGTFSWEDFYKHRSRPSYDFISIDAEGYDLKILEQMDLLELGCSMVCVEHNGIDTHKYIDYLKKYNLVVKLVNAENIIAAI